MLKWLRELLIFAGSWPATSNKTSGEQIRQCDCNHCALITWPGSRWKKAQLPPVIWLLRCCRGRVNHVEKWVGKRSHGVVHQRASVIKHGQTHRSSPSPWNYTGNTQHALAMNSNCFHVFFFIFFHLSYTWSVSASTITDWKRISLLSSRWNRKKIFFSVTCTQSEMEGRAKSHDKCFTLTAKTAGSPSPSLSLLCSEGQTDISTGAKFRLGANRVMTALSFWASELNPRIASIFKLYRSPISAHFLVWISIKWCKSNGVSCNQQSGMFRSIIL